MSYTSIKVPSNLVRLILPIMKEWGYRSISEFIMEATRIHLRRFTQHFQTNMKDQS